MRSTVLSIVTAYCCLCGHLQAQVPRCNEYDSLGLKSGFWHEDRDSSITRGWFVSDRKDGAWIEFSAPGKVKCIRSYQSGVLTGKVLTFHEDGALSMELSVVGGLLNGKSKFYSIKGELIAIYSYVNDVLDKIELYVLCDQSPPRNHDFKPSF